MPEEPPKPQRQELLSDDAAAVYVERIEAMWALLYGRAQDGDSRAADMSHHRA